MVSRSYMVGGSRVVLDTLASCLGTAVARAELETYRKRSLLSCRRRRSSSKPTSALRLEDFLTGARPTTVTCVVMVWGRVRAAMAAAWLHGKSCVCVCKAERAQCKRAEGKAGAHRARVMQRGFRDTVGFVGREGTVCRGHPGTPYAPKKRVTRTPLQKYMKRLHSKPLKQVYRSTMDSMRKMEKLLRLGRVR